MSPRTVVAPRFPRPKCEKEGGFCNDRDAYGRCLAEKACEWRAGMKI